MKILHSADWHLGAYVGPQCDDPMKRMENTVKCLDVLVETAKREQPDIILIAGDIFHQARVWSDRALTEVTMAAKYLDELSVYAPVVVLYGTPNHDGLAQFNALMHMVNEVRICFIKEPKLHIFNTRSGEIQIAGLPGFDKGHFRAQFPGLSAEEENQVFTQQLTQIVQGLSAQLDPNIPSVLMAHHTVVGCELDNGQHVFQANEVVLPAAALDASAFDLVCLGHIHKAQKVKACSKPVYYAGSVDAFTFNDEGHDKLFHIFNTDLTVNHPDFCRSFAMPAREFSTSKWSQLDINEYMKGNLIFSAKDQVVRILYTCDSETEKALDKKKLERDLYAAGAYYVSEIRPESITASVNRERMTEKMTVRDCLVRYLKERHGDMTCKEISDLSWDAEPIIEEVEANSPMGSTSGLFLPVEIEVHNYRSYAEEKFSFEDIFFAMVNGKNGSGKSSLFMDAITDCLYEETRENELTGWIRNGEKSGSISFTFSLGADMWRVTRTRQRSGKATLALAKYVFEADEPGGEYWNDHSCELMKDTQQAIVDLLGMDCDTFQSCVLIMQDRYGKFMEADKSERMAVLANLLGLGIYDELLSITKDKLTDVNRELRQQRIDIGMLEHEVAGEEDLHTELNQVEAELKTAQDDLQESKNTLNELQGKLGAMAGYEQEAARLGVDLKNATDQHTDKKAKKADLEKRVTETESFLQNEQTILDKCAELDKARLDIAALDGKVQLLNDKKARCFKLNNDLLQVKQYRANTAKTLETIRENLKERESLEAVVNGRTVEQDLEACEKKAQEYKNLDNALTVAESQLTFHNEKINNEIASLDYKIKTLVKQAEMLEGTNCVDLSSAHCKFLQSAKEAKVDIEALLKEKQKVISDGVEKRLKLEDTMQKFQSQRDAVGYDTLSHSVLIQSAKEYRSAKDKLAKMAADAATADALEKQDQENAQKVTDIESELAALSNEILILENETNQVDGLKAQISSLTQYERMKPELPKAKQFVESTSETIKQLGSDLEGLTASCNAINGRLTELRQLTVDKGTITVNKIGAEQKVSMLEKAISELNQQIGTINADLNSIAGKKTQLSEKREQLQQSAAKVATLEVLSQAFSQDGIPYQIIRDIVPELEAAANEILGQMTGGRMRLEFVTEKVLKSNKAKEVATLEIIITDVDNGVLPYLSRSGGQKVRTALAVNFALANIKASRVGLQLGMMFVDEPPFLDADGVEAYCSALEVQHEKFPEMRILAISHDENMKARFPQQIQIEVTENGSMVRRL